MLKKNRSYWKILLGVVTLLVGAAAFFVFRTSTASNQGLALTQGQVLHYEISYRSDGQGAVDLKGGAQTPTLSVPEKTVQVEVKSQLQLRVLEKNAAGFSVNFYLKPQIWRMAIDGQDQAKLPESIEGHLRLSRRGQITGFQLDTAVYQSYGFVLADILSLMEFHLPPNSQKEILSVEKGYRGEIPVRFLSEPAQAGHFRLVKSYLASDDQTVEGFGRYDGSHRSYLVAMKAERKRSYADAQGNTSHDITSLTLETSKSQQTLVSSDAKAYTLTETLGGETYRKKVEESIHVNRLGQRTWNDIHALLETLEGSDQKHKTNVLMMLRSYIYLHPRELDVLLPYLTQAGYDQGATGVVAAALTDIGSPEAQDILRKSIELSGDDLERKEKLVAHLVLVETISPESEQAVYRLADEEQDSRVKGAAELGIGVIGHMHLEKQRPGVDRALDFARDRLENAETKADKEHALRILGNIGSPHQIAVIKPYLKDAEESTRYTAIKALRAVNDTQAFATIRQVINEEKNQNLRAAALESLGSHAQDQETYDYLKQQLFLERDDRMIKQVITHLVNMRRNYPEVRGLIEQFILQCGKTDVCGFASSAVASM